MYASSLKPRVSELRKCLARLLSLVLLFRTLPFRGRHETPFHHEQSEGNEDGDDGPDDADNHVPRRTIRVSLAPELPRHGSQQRIGEPSGYLLQVVARLVDLPTLLS